MKYRLLTVAFGAVMAIGSTGICHAQDLPMFIIPIFSATALRVGAASLPGPGCRGTGFAGGLDYFLGGDEGGVGLSLDHYRRPHANATGLTLNLLSIHGFSYMGVGAGVYHVRARGIDGGASGKTGFGMKLTAGYVFSRRFLIQTDYHLPTTSQINGFRGRGFVVTAGVFVPEG